VKGLVSTLRAVYRGEHLTPAQARMVKSALDLVEELLDVLPPGSEAASAFAAHYSAIQWAEGLSPRAARMQKAYQHIESLLNACETFCGSDDIESVETASRILEQGRPKATPYLDVIRGDWIALNYRGAVLKGATPSGVRIELSLRRADPDEDLDLPPNAWVLEGGARAANSNGAPHALLTEVWGETLPDDAAERIGQRVFRLLGACLRNVTLLRPKREQEPRLTERPGSSGPSFA